MADYYKWLDSYNTGVAQIDAQHQGFFRMLNNIYEVLQKGSEKEAVIGLLKGIIDYADVHFKTEEELFDEYDYPGKAHHRAEHDAFRAEAAALQEKLEKGLVTVDFELLDFLDNWVINHITKEDMLYKPFFQEKGVK